MERTDRELVAAARKEVERMREAVGKAEPGARVTMSADNFASIAMIMARLCDLVPEADADGFAGDRHWVPLAQFQRLRRLLGERQAELNELRMRQDVRALISSDGPMQWRTAAPDQDRL